MLTKQQLVALLLAPQPLYQRVLRLFATGIVGEVHYPGFDSGPGGPYCFQDSAGTTPLTAIGQSCGLMLDRGLNGARGAPLSAPAVVLSGGATNNGDGTYTIPSGGHARFNYALGELVNGELYEVLFTIVSLTAGSVGADWADGNGASHTTTGAKRHLGYRATYDATYRFFDLTAGGGGTAVVSVQSCRRVPGTHYIQPTSASRAVVSARVNLLTASEQFDDAAWTKGNSTVTANATTAPNGTTTADKLVEDTANSTHQVSQIFSGGVAGATYVFSVDLKASERTSAVVIITDNATGDGRVVVDLSAGTVAAPSVSGNWSSPVATISASGNGWYRVKLTLTKSAGGNASVVGVVALYNGSATYIGNGTSGAFIWGADLRTADDAAKPLPAYQRTGATPATDHDTAGFPLYLPPDATDDFYATTATVDGSAYDKVTAVYGITKLSDAAQAIVQEHTATTASNAGHYFAAPDSAAANYGAATRGATTTAQRRGTTYTAPVSSVVTVEADNSTGVTATNVVLTVNDATPTMADVSGPTAAGNFANATTYLFGRAGAGTRFAGRWYGHIRRFGPMTAAEKAVCRAFIKQLMKLP